MTARRSIAIFPTGEVLADAAAGAFVAAAAGAIASRGRFVAALSGGSTPRLLHARLAREPFVSQVAWDRVQVLWSDERGVPPDHAESNYRMARETLLDQVPIPAAHIHRIRGEDDPAVAAAAYESTVRALLDTPAGPPRTAPGACIDLVLLGLGEDGHTASLFPARPAMKERTRWAVADADATSLPRVTLTLPLLNAAAAVLFLVEGASKRGMVRQVIEGPRHPHILPAQAIAPSHGTLRWLLDTAAAAGLSMAVRTEPS